MANFNTYSRQSYKSKKTCRNSEETQHHVFQNTHEAIIDPETWERVQEELREKLPELNEEIIQQERQAENMDRFIGKVRKYLALDERTTAF